MNAKTTPQQSALAWLSRFEHFIRQREWDKAAVLFHTNVYYFGLFITAEKLEDVKSREWPEISAGNNFTFGMASAKVIPFSNEAFLIAVPWIHAPIIVGAPTKKGRMSAVLIRFSNAKLLCIQCHMSREGGV